jgi:hypothetical protein
VRRELHGEVDHEHAFAPCGVEDCGVGSMTLRMPLSGNPARPNIPSSAARSCCMSTTITAEWAVSSSKGPGRPRFQQADSQQGSSGNPAPPGGHHRRLGRRRRQRAAAEVDVQLDRGFAVVGADTDEPGDAA